MVKKKDLSVIYGGKVTNGSLIVYVAFNEKDLEPVFHLTSKVKEAGFKKIVSDDILIAKIIREIRSMYLSIITRYRFFTLGELAEKESKFCVEEFTKEITENRVSEYNFLGFTEGDLGDLYIPNTLKCECNDIRDNKYLAIGYIFWTYYRRVLDGKNMECI